MKKKPDVSKSHPCFSCKIRKYESIFMVFFLVTSPDDFEDHFKIARKCHKDTQAHFSSIKNPIGRLCSIIGMKKTTIFKEVLTTSGNMIGI